jgi:hypothetical protein
VLANGNVGIGTATPSSPLTIANNKSTTVPVLSVDTLLGGSTGSDNLMLWRSTDGSVRQTSVSSIANFNNITTQISSYIVAANDYTILMNCASTALTITLPPATGNTGRVLVVSKADDSSNPLTFSTSIRQSVSNTIASVNYQTVYTLQSDGASWWIIGRY